MNDEVPPRLLAERGARILWLAFDDYHAAFRQITQRARSRFEQCDWQGGLADSVERLDLYGLVVTRCVEGLRQALGSRARDEAVWAMMKPAYAQLISGRADLELGETFFNSITRRIFATVGVKDGIEFVASDFDFQDYPRQRPIYCRYLPAAGLGETLIHVLQDYPFAIPYEDLEGDAARAAGEICAHLAQTYGSDKCEAVDMLKAVFYRGHGAYLVGRILVGASLNPLLIALFNRCGHVYVDAVLLTEDEVSIIFSYTRSYFHVEADIPHQVISFLRSILPLKRVAELYISIGFHKHGKTELYRDLLRHLEHSTDRFELARGERGMVMAVFTLPSYDMVFKVIRDRFAEPKNTTRQDVIDRYQLVFKHDRAGRLIDAQEFEHLEFEAARFSPVLIKELLDTAASSVQLSGGRIAIRHLYLERRMTPLDVFMREAQPEAAAEAVNDYGQAIKDLAATNIFPGDVLLKNFGVTRHGRVVFYDYDELTLLTDCKFRRMPQPSELSDEMSAEPWFYVGKDDIFPEEFRTFLGLQEPYRSQFDRQHGDLFGVEYWRTMQKRHKNGEVIDIIPYKQSKSFCAAALPPQ
jgi:isocitrate dehydrogenase kinase/phosphatase